MVVDAGEFSPDRRRGGMEVTGSTPILSTSQLEITAADPFFTCVGTETHHVDELRLICVTDGEAFLGRTCEPSIIRLSTTMNQKMSDDADCGVERPNELDRPMMNEDRHSFSKGSEPIVW